MVVLNPGLLIYYTTYYCFQESSPNCRYLDRYTILIKDRNGVPVNETTLTSAGVVSVSNLAGFTEYTVTVTAINDANRKSVQETVVLTAETGMY